MKQKWLMVWACLKKVPRLFLSNHCSMHAAGLTYYAMLALVPILCILLLAAKTFRADDFVKRQVNEQIDAMITNIERGQDDDLARMTVSDEEKREERRQAAEAFATQARSIRDGLFERIDKFDVGTLGWIGFGMLVWTVISSIGMVEVSFNEIWGIAKPRVLWRRSLLYLFVVVVIPVLAALAMSVPLLKIVKDVIVWSVGASSLTQWVSDGLVWFIDSWIMRLIVTLVFSSLAFAFLYKVIPNCAVRFRPAWYGGLLTAILFGGWMKLCAVAQVGIAKSSALYGSFAFLPIVLAWLYMSWQLILLGACFVRSVESVCAEAEVK